jgi:hypothetical protein
MKPAMVAGLREPDWTNFEPFLSSFEAFSYFSGLKIPGIFGLTLSNFKLSVI